MYCSRGAVFFSQTENSNGEVGGMTSFSTSRQQKHGKYEKQYMLDDQEREDCIVLVGLLLLKWWNALNAKRSDSMIDLNILWFSDYNETIKI